MKTHILLVRHGKSTAADLGIVQGQGLDIPLTDEGRRQARRTGEFLAAYSLNKIYTSTAIRATDTARIIREYHQRVPYEELDELNERSKGVAEGMSKDAFDQKYPFIIEQWERGIDARPEGGESFEDVHHRVAPLFDQHVAESAPGQTLLYVIHGNVIRVLLGYILNIPHNRCHTIKQDYCAVNAMSFDHSRNRWEVEYVNRIFH